MEKRVRLVYVDERNTVETSPFFNHFFTKNEEKEEEIEDAARDRTRTLNTLRNILTKSLCLPCAPVYCTK